MASDGVESGRQQSVLFRGHRIVPVDGHGRSGLETVRILQSQKLRFHHGVLVEHRKVGSPSYLSLFLLLFRFRETIYRILKMKRIPVFIKSDVSLEQYDAIKP